MRNQKGITPLLVILSITIIIGFSGVIFYQVYIKQPPSFNNSSANLSSPSTNVTPSTITSATPSVNINNWKIYTNNDLGISFSYPAEYKLVNGFFYPTNSTLNYRNEKIGAIFTNTDANSNFSHCYIKDKDYEEDILFIDKNLKILSKTPLKVNDIQGSKETIETLFAYDSEGEGKLYMTNFCFTRNSKVITLSMFNYDHLPSKEDNGLFDQIFSSFNVIK